MREARRNADEPGGNGQSFQGLVEAKVQEREGRAGGAAQITSQGSSSHPSGSGLAGVEEGPTRTLLSRTVGFSLHWGRGAGAGFSSPTASVQDVVCGTVQPGSPQPIS